MTRALPWLAAALTVAVLAWPTLDWAPWAGISAIVTAATWLGIGWWLLQRAAPPRCEPEKNDDALPLTLALATGMAVTVLLTEASGWLLKGPLPGPTLVILAIPGWRRMVAKTPSLRAESAIVLLVAVVLGLPGRAPQGGKLDGVYLFSDRWGDYRYHLHLGNLIDRLGMPIVDPYGWPAAAHNPLGHRGAPLLVAATRRLGVVGAIDAGRILGLLGMVLLAGAGLALGRQVSRRRGAGVIGALCAVAWAPMTALYNSLHALRHHGIDAAWRQLSLADPTYYLQPAGLAGGAFHNLPQLLSVGMCAAGVAGLGIAWVRDDKESGDQRSRRGWTWLGCGLVAVSGLVKPSAFVLVMPAVAIVAMTRPERGKALLALGVTAAMAVAIYLLPRWIVGVPSYQGVVVDVSGWTVKQWLLRMGLATGAVWAPGLVALVGVGAVVNGRRRWSVQEALLIAALGGLLFATLFVEADADKRWHGNMTWGLAGVLPLCGPIVIERGRRMLQKPRILGQIAGWALLACALLQIVPGVLYAARYPTARRRNVDGARVQYLLGFEEHVRGESGKAVLAEPKLVISDLTPAFSFPLVTKMAFSPAPRKRWGDWVWLVRTVEADRPLSEAGLQVLAGYELVLLRKDSAAMRRFLTSRGFIADTANYSGTRIGSWPESDLLLMRRAPDNKPAANPNEQASKR